MWGVKASLVSVVIGEPGPVIPKLGERLQQIPGITLDITVQKRAIPGITKILHRTLRLHSPSLKKTQNGPKKVGK